MRDAILHRLALPGSGDPWFSRAVHGPAALLVLVSAAAARMALASENAPASPLLPPGHWAVEAADRLEQLGLVERFMPAQRAVPLLVVARALAEGERRAWDRRPDLAPLLAAWRRRFESEWPGASSAGGGSPIRRLGSHVGLGYQDGSARESSTDPPPAGRAALHLEAPGSDPFVDLGTAAALGDHLAAGARLRATPWQVGVPELELVGAVGPLALSLGRGPVGYGPSDLGAVVASGAVALDRAELMTTAPVRLPGPLSALGDFALDLALTRFSQARHPYRPLLWLFQLQWRPHPRLTLGAIRGVMFGGSLWEGIPAERIPVAILGIKNYRENNVYSGSIRLRLPTEALLPLTAKVEWGTDDEPGAAFSWPGLVAGLSAPMLPGLPAELGVEYAYFGRGPFGFHAPFAWYAHGQYVGGWASGETPLGDPLAGNGRALRLVASADPLEGRLRLSAVGWVQERFADNLHAPGASGRSLGLRAEAELRLGRGALGVRGAHETGRDGWRRTAVEAGATLFF